MTAGEVHRSIVAQHVELLRDIRTASTDVTVHDDLAVGWNFPEPVLYFAHRNIHGAGNAAVVDDLVRFAYIQQERRGAVIEKLPHSPGVIDFTYNGGGTHFPDVTRQVAMTAGVWPAGNGDPFSGVSAPLLPI